jgi:hypothetical protein
MSLALPPSLSLAVYVEILNIQKKGYISDAMIEDAINSAEIIATKSDTLMYDSQSGEASRIFAKLSRAVAILAFQPGGVEIFGQKYEAKLTK